MDATATTGCGVEILARVIQPAEAGLSLDAARSILELRLAPADCDRVNLLAAKARQGTLTTEERAELNEYEHVTALLELMQSKARRSLKNAGLAS
jgi:uncharacterized protein YnzC (UPF0291/DUF896 family)